MDITILLNITCVLGSIQFNTTEYYIQYYSILHVKSYNITQYYMHIGLIWVVFNAIFLNIQWIFQYYSILHVKLSNTHFNILLHIGEYWFQYCVQQPRPGPAGDGQPRLRPRRHWPMWRRFVVGHFNCSFRVKFRVKSQASRVTSQAAACLQRRGGYRDHCKKIKSKNQ